MNNVDIKNAVLLLGPKGEKICIKSRIADDLVFVTGEPMPVPRVETMIHLNQYGASAWGIRGHLPPPVGTRMVIGGLAGPIVEADAFCLVDKTWMLFMTIEVNLFDGATAVTA